MVGLLCAVSGELEQPSCTLVRHERTLLPVATELAQSLREKIDYSPQLHPRQNPEALGSHATNLGSDRLG